MYRAGLINEIAQLKAALAEARKHAQFTVCSYCGKVSDCGTSDLDAKRKVALDHILECDKRPELQLIDAGIDQMREIAALQGALRELRDLTRGSWSMCPIPEKCTMCTRRLAALAAATELLEGK